ncbi:lysine-specific demethylase JMJ30 [Senna tora]|uniref:Lysine-specific demethylase JMJ30 n=1 Tax=Senna tora TaxID=362788 RepID=A0A834TU22_9FABA|nr:lysine-specific demethylase JMJ30 [Senna tora]
MDLNETTATLHGRPSNVYAIALALVDYLKRVAGDRTIPVEVGKNSLCVEWKQELITFSELLQRIESGGSSSSGPTYLGHHPLFDQVDLDDIDESKFPNVRDLEFVDCNIEEGEMLYIPPKWWHYVRSLTTSFFVSFWWSKGETCAF